MVIEEDLRRALADRAAAVPPPVPGLAEAAVRGAGRLRRRRALVAVATGVLVFATVGLAVAGTGVPRGGRPAVLAAPVSARPRGTSGTSPGAAVDSPSARAATTAGPDLDIVSAGVLSTVDGHRIRLPDPALTTAYRVPLGWLALSATDPGRALWLVRSDGSAHEVLARVSTAGLAVAPDGTRVAWQRGVGTPLTVATLSVGGLSDPRVAQVGAGVALAGWYGRYVALGVRRGSAAGFERVDVWDPAGPYRPGSTAAAVDILGLATDRGTLLGLARPAGRGAPACLVRLDPARRLAAAGRRCLPDLTAAGRFALSPDGRMLAGRAGPGHLAVVDIAGTGPARPVTSIACDRDTQEVWADAQTLVISTGSGLLRYRVGAPGPVTLAGTAHGQVSLVPRMGG